MNKIEAALDYLRRGFSVIPILPGEKRPYLEWKQYQTRKATPEEVTSWTDNCPDIDIGIVTGGISSETFVLDVDDPALADRLCSEAIFSDALIHKTPRGGMHFFFQAKTPGIRNMSLRPFGIEGDIRANGGYVVAPPSVGYEVFRNGSTVAVQDEQAVFKLLGISVSEKSGIRPDLSAPIRTGQRNIALTSIVGTILHNLKGDPALARECLSLINERCLEEPLTELELNVIFSSISRRENAARKQATSDKNLWRCLDEIIETEDPEIRWAWHGFLAYGFSTLLASTPKVGKTSLMFSLLAAIKAKQPFLGHETSGHEGSILILTEEHEKLYRKRAEAYGLTGKDILVLPCHVVKDMGWKEILGQVERAIDAENVTLIIVDTLSAFWHIQDESDSAKVQPAVNALTNIVQEKNVACLIMHHMRKTAGEGGSMIRGSNALPGAVDMPIEMKRTPKRRNQFVLDSYSRFSETPESLLIERNNQHFLALGDADQYSKEQVKKSILDALTEEYLTGAEIAERLPEKPSESQIRQAFIDLRKAQAVDFMQEKSRGRAFRYKRKAD